MPKGRGEPGTVRGPEIAMGSAVDGAKEEGSAGSAPGSTPQLPACADTKFHFFCRASPSFGFWAARPRADLWCGMGTPSSHPPTHPALRLENMTAHGGGLLLVSSAKLKHL